MLNRTVVVAGLGLLAASNVALAQSAPQYGVSQQYETHAQATARNGSADLNELQRAAQRLRESIQAIARLAPGTQRNHALRSAHEALFDTNQAMLRLPVEYRGSAFTWSPSQAMRAQQPAGQTPQAALQQLRKASERLFDGVHAMAREASTPGRASAIREANEALIETHTAMAWVYDQQLAGNPAQGLGQTASSTGAQGAFSAGGRGSTAARAGGSSVTGGHDAQASSVSAVAGGVGINARARLSEHALPEHNVKMVFALDAGNYVADVKVTVKDRSGRTVIDGEAGGPWLYAKLPAGSYTATAVFNGETVIERFDVGRSGQRTAIFRWPASAAHAASGVSPILGTGSQNEAPATAR